MVNLDMTLREWLARYQREIVFDQVTWMGVPTQKNVLDAWIYQEILHEVRPDVVVEIGSNTGGSTLFLAHMLDIIGHGTVLSIDICRDVYQVEHPRIVTVTGDSASHAIPTRARLYCRDQRVMVIHDGDHHREQVRKDLELYAPLVAVGSYLIVEDSIVDVMDITADYIRPGEGPLPAIEDFLAAHPEFQVDESRERHILTYNPRGFLKRIH